MKTRRTFTFVALAALCAAASCTKIPETHAPAPPRIIPEGDEPIYRTRVAEPLTLAPRVENVGNDAAYRWSIEGKAVGYTPSFTYTGTEAGSVYLLFEVVADNGQAEAELRIDVVPLRAPTVTLPVPPAGYSLLQGSEITLSPQVTNAEGAAFQWQVDGTTVSAEREYTFRGEETGRYALSFTASNEDGADSVAFTVRVCTEEQMDFDWRFEQTVYHVAAGRTAFIRPYRVENAFDARYTWKVNGQPIEAPAVEHLYAGPAPACILAFTPPAEGTYRVEAVMTNSYVEHTQHFTVHCCPAEGTYRRTPSPASSARCDKVYEFTAAPGQFVNERYTATDAAMACAYAQERMREGAYVSLGAFGGCLVVGFDHSVENDGGYNLRVDGNSFEGSSEPGIVWVMQDENGNGLPDDTWYELKGSEWGGTETRLDYAVTYYRPAGPGQPVMWTDNEGGSGRVEYLPAFHTQDSYYPAWITEDSYTLVGRKLKPRTEMIAENHWTCHPYEWGYADNFSPVDRLTDDDNPTAAITGNHFRISDAVTYDGRPAELKYIDFVKIQTGVQATVGWLGELSTEVCGVSDYNLLKER